MSHEACGRKWLSAIQRRLEVNKIQFSYKRPLYAASFIFNREVDVDGVWRVNASASAKAPLIPSWSETLRASGTVGLVSQLSTHVEKISAKPHQIEWSFIDGELRVACGDEVRSLTKSALDAPIVSSADLFFLIQDTWQPELHEVSVIIAVARKLYGAVIRNRGRDLIAGEFFSLKWPSSTDQEVRSLASSFEASLRDSRKQNFELGWDDESRRLTFLRLKVPMIGHVQIEAI